MSPSPEDLLMTVTFVLLDICIYFVDSSIKSISHVCAICNIGKSLFKYLGRTSFTML